MAAPKSRAEYRDIIAKEFVASLNEKGLNWKRGWDVQSMQPQNAVTERPYHGVNEFYLGLLAMNRGYTDPRWATMVQIMDRDGKYHPGEKWHLQKGSKGVYVEYWYPWDTEKMRAIPWKEYRELTAEAQEAYQIRVQYTPVFHASMIDGIAPFQTVEREPQPLSDIVSKLSANMGVELLYDGGTKAFYRPSEDKVHLPRPELFHGEYELNATALHELAHATGHTSRLNRNQEGWWGTPEYAYEELVAEISSCFMGVTQDVEQMPQHMENHKAYVQSWIQAITDKPETLMEAIRDARAAADYMDYQAGLVSEQEHETAKENTAEVSRQAVEQAAQTQQPQAQEAQVQEGQAQQAQTAQAQEVQAQAAQPQLPQQSTEQAKAEQTEKRPEMSAPPEQAPKPVVQSLDQFLGERGLSSPISDYMLDKLRLPHGQTDRQQKAMEREAEQARNEYLEKRAAATVEYARLVSEGAIRPPTNIEQLLLAASGHEDNFGTQAARRALEKRGIDWRTGEARTEHPPAAPEPGERQETAAEAQAQEAQVQEAQVQEAQAQEAQAQEVQAQEVQAQVQAAQTQAVQEAQAREAQVKEAQAQEADEQGPTYQEMVQGVYEYECVSELSEKIRMTKFSPELGMAVTKPFELGGVQVIPNEHMIRIRYGGTASFRDKVHAQFEQLAQESQVQEAQTEQVQAEETQTQEAETQEPTYREMVQAVYEFECAGELPTEACMTKYSPEQGVTVAKFFEMDGGQVWASESMIQDRYEGTANLRDKAHTQFEKLAQQSMTYTIYRRKDPALAVHLSKMQRDGTEVDLGDYDKLGGGPLGRMNLEDISGLHHLSLSDLVVIDYPGSFTAHYFDGDAGFPELPEIAQQIQKDMAAEREAQVQQAEKEPAPALDPAAAAGMTVEEYAAGGYEASQQAPAVEPTAEGISAELYDLMCTYDPEFMKGYSDRDNQIAGTVRDILNNDTAHIELTLIGLREDEKAPAAVRERAAALIDTIDRCKELNNTYSIYQLRGGEETRDIRFEPYDRLQAAGRAVDPANYELVYTAPLSDLDTLESLYHKFNIEHPKDFTGHSLSVSDIVVLRHGDRQEAHYCDDVGFREVPEFLRTQQKELTQDELMTGELEARAKAEVQEPRAAEMTNPIPTPVQAEKKPAPALDPAAAAGMTVEEYTAAGYKAPQQDAHSSAKPQEQAATITETPTPKQAEPPQQTKSERKRSTRPPARTKNRPWSPWTRSGNLRYTEEQYKIAREASALEYARRQGYHLTGRGRRYSLKEHDSMVFLADGRWFWNSHNLSGRAIEFMMEYEGKTLPEAVLTLNGIDYSRGPGHTPSVQSSRPVQSYKPTQEDLEAANTKEEFVLPDRAEKMSRVFSYLCTTRGLDYDLVRQLVHEKRVYEGVKVHNGKELHNAVFVGFDEQGEAKSAFLRGCSESSFKMEVPGSDKTHPFEIPGKEGSQTLVIFEAAIDAASHASIQKLAGLDWQACHRISQGGNAPVEGILNVLKAHPKVRHIVFCLDNDAAGQKIFEGMRDNLVENGIDADSIQRQSVPIGKDWNEYLQIWRKTIGNYKNLPTTELADGQPGECQGRIHFLAEDGTVERTVAYTDRRHFENSAAYRLRKLTPCVVETPAQLTELDRVLKRRAQREAAKQTPSQARKAEPERPARDSGHIDQTQRVTMADQLAFAAQEAERRNQERQAAVLQHAQGRTVAQQY